MLKSHLSSKHIILGSGSPRRQELMKQLDVPFEIRLKPIDESYPKILKHHQISDYLSQLKAKAFEGCLKTNDILITCDTIVWHRDEALGKPKCNQHAFEILSQLSGQTHEVITSVCLASVNKSVTVHAITKVTFKVLTSDEINYYIQNFDVLDKAGAYGIQDWIGQIGITKIEGSYYNVMGFPTDIIYENLLKF